MDATVTASKTESLRLGLGVKLMPTTNWESIARSAYNAYGEFTGFKTYSGAPMFKWEEIGENIQQAWIAATKEVVRVTKNTRLENYPEGSRDWVELKDLGD